MIIDLRAEPTTIPSEVRRRIDSDVRAALNSIITKDGQFVVNDSTWYQLTNRGNVARVVMNQAEFISKQCEGFLESHRNWERQKTLTNQTIDAFIEIKYPGATYAISGESFRDYAVEYWSDHPLSAEGDIVDHLSFIVRHFVNRRSFDLDQIADKYRHHFELSEAQNIRIGMEFETGNIASAFRSFSKLNTLFGGGAIDAGVFITATKDASGRIWPRRNRNTTWEELGARSYHTNLQVPLWEYSFAPDGYSEAADFLRSDCTTYEVVETGRTVHHGGRERRIYSRPIDNIECFQ